jgi:hypothetical protein
MKRGNSKFKKFWKKFWFFQNCEVTFETALKGGLPRFL